MTAQPRHTAPARRADRVSSRYVYADRADLRDGVEKHILTDPWRRDSLRRARAEDVASWLLVSRRTLFETLARLDMTLGDLQRLRF